MEIIHYRTGDGTDVYQKWMDALQDKRARIAVLRRVDSAAQGDLGDHRLCQGGVSELRVDVGPGYRVYCFQRGQTLVLLCGGDKRTEGTDVNRALAYGADFLRRINPD